MRRGLDNILVWIPTGALLRTGLVWCLDAAAARAMILGDDARWPARPATPLPRIDCILKRCIRH
jgi:hypothetical protein